MVENQLSSTSLPVWMERKFRSLRKQMDGTTPQHAWFNFPSFDALLLWHHCHILLIARGYSKYLKYERLGQIKDGQIKIIWILMKISREITLNFGLGCFYFFKVSMFKMFQFPVDNYVFKLLVDLRMCQWRHNTSELSKGRLNRASWGWHYLGDLNFLFI